MINKDIKSLRRTELIEIIYQLKKNEQEYEAKIETLNAEAEALNAEIETLNCRLEERSLKMEEVGSVAEAAMSLSDVFAAAQEAADIYLEEIKNRHVMVEEECKEILASAKKKADEMIEEATQQRAVIIEQCRVSRKELRRVQTVIQELNDDLQFDK